MLGRQMRIGNCSDPNSISYSMAMAKSRVSTSHCSITFGATTEDYITERLRSRIVHFQMSVPNVRVAAMQLYSIQLTITTLTTSCIYRHPSVCNDVKISPVFRCFYASSVSSKLPPSSQKSTEAIMPFCSPSYLY